MVKRHSSNRPPPSAKNRPPPTKSRPPPSGNQNLLLAALPTDDYARIRPSLSVVPLKLKDVLHKPGEPIRDVYFPGGGFCSLLTVLQDGNMVEIATIGREGMVGVSAALEGNPATAAAMVQGETDTCYRMKVEAFRQEIDRHGAFYELVNHYGQALFGFVAQCTACNAIHSVEQRLARWLLMAQDRMDSDDFPLTQEFVAMMLGASRPTVTVVAGTLQKAGLITYRHGRITVVDREGLESASCECYRAATDLLKCVTDGSRQLDRPNDLRHG
jgi:CRP-like cAMP-binding protein